MKNSDYSLIPNWAELHHICAGCGTDKSVKYLLKGKTICNKCFGIYLQTELDKVLKKLK